MSIPKPWEDGGADSKKQLKRQPWASATSEVNSDVVRAHERERASAGASRNIDAVKAQAFAKCYLIDCDHRNAAALAFGIEDDERARRTGLDYLRHPLVLQAIQNLIPQIESEKLVTRERIMMGLLQEATYFGVGSSHSARVAAWGKLAQMTGSDKPVDPEQDAAGRAGVMLVPMIGSIEEWESTARTEQAKLKADVRT